MALAGAAGPRVGAPTGKRLEATLFGYVHEVPLGDGAAAAQPAFRGSLGGHDTRCADRLLISSVVDLPPSTSFAGDGL